MVASSEIRCYFCADACPGKYWVRREIGKLTVLVAVCKKCLIEKEGSE